MTDEKDILNQGKDEEARPVTKQASIRILPGEQSGQPLYSNFSSVNGGQGVVLVDFGFLDPQNLNTLNQMAKSGEKLPDTVNVKLSSRLAISIDTAHHLSQQLNQLLIAKPPAAVVQEQKDTDAKKDKDTAAEDTVTQTDSSTMENGVDAQKNDKGGFRFPWSKKMH